MNFMSILCLLLTHHQEIHRLVELLVFIFGFGFRTIIFYLRFAFLNHCYFRLMIQISEGDGIIQVALLYKDLSIIQQRVIVCHRCCLQWPSYSGFSHVLGLSIFLVCRQGNLCRQIGCKSVQCCWWLLLLLMLGWWGLLQLYILLLDVLLLWCIQLKSVFEQCLNLLVEQCVCI